MYLIKSFLILDQINFISLKLNKKEIFCLCEFLFEKK
jgi:hypothetical protein